MTTPNSVPLSKDENFTFESNLDSTPVSENFNPNSPTFKATSPLKINIFSKNQVEQINNSEGPVLSPATPKQDYNYIFNKLSPMPGSWITKQNEKFEQQDKEFLNPSGTKFNEFLNSPNGSPNGSPLSLKISGNIKGQLESVNSNNKSPVSNSLDDSSPVTNPLNYSAVSSQRPAIPPNSTIASHSPFSRMLEMGESLSSALGLHNNKQDDSFNNDTSLATVHTNDLDIINETGTETDTSINDLEDKEQPIPRAADITSPNSRSSYVEELNFDDEKTPVVSQFKFLEPETTPNDENNKRFTNPLNSENRLSDYKYARAPSPYMGDPIYEDEEPELVNIDGVGNTPNLSRGVSLHDISGVSLSSPSERVSKGAGKLTLINNDHDNLYRSFSGGAQNKNLFLNKLKSEQDTPKKNLYGDELKVPIYENGISLPNSNSTFSFDQSYSDTKQANKTAKDIIEDEEIVHSSRSRPALTNINDSETRNSSTNPQVLNALLTPAKSTSSTPITSSMAFPPKSAGFGSSTDLPPSSAETLKITVLPSPKELTPVASLKNPEQKEEETPKAEKRKTPLNQKFPLARDLTISKSKRKARKDAEKAAEDKFNKENGAAFGAAAAVTAATGIAVTTTTKTGIPTIAFSANKTPSSPITPTSSVGLSSPSTPSATTTTTSTRKTILNTNIASSNSATPNYGYGGLSTTNQAYSGVTASTTRANGFTVKKVMNANGVGPSSSSSAIGTTNPSSANTLSSRGYAPAPINTKVDGAISNPMLSGNTTGSDSFGGSPVNIVSIIGGTSSSHSYPQSPTSPPPSVAGFNNKPRVSVRQNSLYQNYSKQKQELSYSNSKGVNYSSSPSTATMLTSASMMHSDSTKQIFDLTPEEDPMIKENEDEDAIDASALFVTATYPFDASSLESANDASICLSFNQGDIAFTYTLDESGWGEVTLLNSLKRGWVPMNYFRPTLVDDDEDDDEKDVKKWSRKKLADSRKPLRVLLRNAGRFLLDPQSKPLLKKQELVGYTFDINYINGITFGVRNLLKETDCISRSSLVVQKKPVVRKLRKKLLRDWSDLIFKAKDYLHTIDGNKIEYLQLMTYQVLHKALTFLDVWGIESAALESELNKNNSRPGLYNKAPITYLEKPPAPEYRINEVYNQLMRYLALISGRLDLVEHNIHGCRMLEMVVSQINLLVGELQFLGQFTRSKLPEDVNEKNITNNKFSNLPAQLKTIQLNGEKLAGLIQKLNSDVRFLVDVANRRLIANNIKNDGRPSRGPSAKRALPRSNTWKQPRKRQQYPGGKNIYFYSKEGGNVINSACKMIQFTTSTYRILKNLVSWTNEFELPLSRKYPNFIQMEIKPNVFIKKSSVGLAKDRKVKNQVRQHNNHLGSPIVTVSGTDDEPPKSPGLPNGGANGSAPNSAASSPALGKDGDEGALSASRLLVPGANGANRNSKRFSIFRTGNSGDMELNDDGLDFLAGISTGDSPFIGKNNEFSKFLDGSEMSTSSSPNINSNDDEIILDPFNPEDEIIREVDNHKLLGASFKSLVALLTDEANPPDYFFISTFFLTFRIFANGSILLEELITRFDVNDSVMKAAKFKGGLPSKFTTLDTKIKTRRKLVCKTFQLWLESYWKPRTDYILLAPLINFFNEAVTDFMPLEGFRLLETASRLVGQPPVETMKDKLNYYNNIDNDSQLVPRKISPKLQKKHLSKMSLLNGPVDSDAGNSALINNIDAYNNFMDDVDTYELQRVDSNGSNASNKTSPNRNSINFSLKFDLKKNGSNSLLVTPKQVQSIHKVIISYRNMLMDHWIKGSITGQYAPTDTQTLIESWWSASQESWKILNEDLALLNFNALEIAKQLTLVESKMFCSIKVEELLNQNFTTKKLHLNLSPNIQRSVLFTNLLSDYVIESILQPKLSLKQRVHALKCWLKISISCLYLRNFNSLASIMTSLQSFLISRISKIWEELPAKYLDLFHYLASIILPDKNYQVYRVKLKEFLDSNLEENLDIPLVPYLSLFLQDMTFVVDGNPNYRTNTKSFLEQKLINIDKYFKITKIISDLQTLQVAYKDIGELGDIYNNERTDLVRSATIKNLKSQINLETGDMSFADMFDISGVPCLQELILLEVWKVKQVNAKEEDRSWKLSCQIQPRDE